MKKVLMILSMVALTIALAVSASFAASVVQTAHDVASLTTSQGTCSVCHIPHKSPGGERLWASNMAGVSGNGTVGNLCFACHSTAGVYGAPAGDLPNAGVCGPFVLPSPLGVPASSSLAHQLDGTTYTYTIDGAGTDELSGIVTLLPYTGKGIANGDQEDEVGSNNLIQCTTCHNVHDNTTAKPFLRFTIRDLCVKCHANRHEAAYGNAATLINNWVGFGDANFGSHPVGPNVTGDVSGLAGGSPIIAFTAAGGYMQVFQNAAGVIDGTGWTDGSGMWNLGKHTANNAAIGTALPGTGVGDGVVCVSCHAIHGVQDDSNVAAGSVAVANLLAVQQGTATLSGMTVANGLGDQANGLCEACHHADNAGAPFASAAAWAAGGAPDANFLMNNASAAYSTAAEATHYPNPGGTPYTHPIDDGVVGTLWGTAASLVTAFPANWPSGAAAAADAGDPRPICESCHVPHGYRNSAQIPTTKARGDVELGTVTNIGITGGFLLRDQKAEVCDQCHGAGNTSCWSDNGADNDGAHTAWRHHPTGNVGVALLGTVGNQDAILTCNDCHNGTGAHNWGGPSAVGLDPTWIPAQNGRVGTFAPPSAGGDTIAGVTPQASFECERCHAIFGGGLGSSPTLGNPLSSGNAEWCSEPEFQKTGSGTHFLGDVSAVFPWAEGSVNGGVAKFNVAAAAWPLGGWSRWDSLTSANAPATAGQHLVCESCHELEPDKNRPNSKLLLHKFNEDTTFGAGRAEFCEGCHSHNPGMQNSHPMTGDTPSKSKILFSNALRPCNDVTEKIPLDDGATPQPRALNGYSTYSAGVVGPGAPAYPPAGSGRSADTTVGSCDMCHQVHDAATQGATYILDAPELNVLVGSGANDANDDIRGGAEGAAHNLHPNGNLDADYTRFCEQCHCYTK